MLRDFSPSLAHLAESRPARPSLFVVCRPIAASRTPLVGAALSCGTKAAEGAEGATRARPGAPELPSSSRGFCRADASFFPCCVALSAPLLVRLAVALFGRRRKRAVRDCAKLKESPTVQSIFLAQWVPWGVTWSLST